MQQWGVAAWRAQEVHAGHGQGTVVRPDLSQPTG